MKHYKILLCLALLLSNAAFAADDASLVFSPMHNEPMQFEVLSQQEMETTEGQVLWVGATIGAAAGGVSGYMSDGWGGVLPGAALGAASGATGGMAGATTGFARFAWGARSAGLGLAGSGGSFEKTVSDP